MVWKAERRTAKGKGSRQTFVWTEGMRAKQRDNWRVLSWEMIILTPRFIHPWREVTWMNKCVISFRKKGKKPLEVTWLISHLRWTLSSVSAQQENKEKRKSDHWPIVDSVCVFICLCVFDYLRLCFYVCPCPFACKYVFEFVGDFI